jgi:uncharacterized DUF497 family protein
VIFDWDDANRSHIARHNVLPNEVEQVFYNDPLLLENYNQNGEERFNLVGETNRGRFLVVAVTWRGDAYRPITAWDATRSAKLDYLQWKGAIL